MVAVAWWWWWGAAGRARRGRVGGKWAADASDGSGRGRPAGAGAAGSGRTGSCGGSRVHGLDPGLLATSLLQGLGLLGPVRRHQHAGGAGDRPARVQCTLRCCVICMPCVLCMSCVCGGGNARTRPYHYHYYYFLILPATWWWCGAGGLQSTMRIMHDGLQRALWPCSVGAASLGDSCNSSTSGRIAHMGTCTTSARGMHAQAPVQGCRVAVPTIQRHAWARGYPRLAASHGSRCKWPRRFCM